MLKFIKKFSNQQQYTNYTPTQNSYSNQNTNQNPSTNTVTWLTRYYRKGFIKKHILQEDEVLLAEHIENLNKKKGKNNFFLKKISIFLL